MSKRYILTHHAQERIRQRYGIQSLRAAETWINTKMANAKQTKTAGPKTHFEVEDIEVITDGDRVVTVKPVVTHNRFLPQLKGVLSKELRKLKAERERIFRRVDIEVTQLTLNLLKAKNPQTKALIERKLLTKTDERARLDDELTEIRNSAEYYGVEV